MAILCSRCKIDVWTATPNTQKESKDNRGKNAEFERDRGREEEKEERRVECFR